jgi:hypothetical protein
MRKILFLLPICCLSVFAVGQRDTIIIHEKGDLDIIERYQFYPNGIPKSITYQSSGERPIKAYSKEDLFVRGIKPDQNDSILIDATKEDSITYFRNDGRIDSKRYNEESIDIQTYFFAHYVYNENKSLIRIDTQYLGLPREISFSNNTLILKSRPDKNIREDVKIPMTKVGQRIKIPLEINSELDEAIKIIVNSSRFPDNTYISDTYFELEPNQNGKVFLTFFVNRTYQTNSLSIKVISCKETYNIDLTYHIKGFHFLEDVLKEAVGITHDNNQELALKFNDNHKRSIKIYKNKEIVLDKTSTKGFAELYISKLEKGDYYLEIIDEITKEKISVILTLK